MTNKTILSVSSPATQTREAVKQPEYVRRARILDEMREERVSNAVGPLQIVSSKGSYMARKKRTTFVVREVDATGKEIRRFEVWDQKTDKGYVWSCSCGKPDCRHIAKAKAVFFSEKREKAAPSMPKPTEGPRRLAVPPEKMNFFLEDGARIDGYMAGVV